MDESERQYRKRASESRFEHLDEVQKGFIEYWSNLGWVDWGHANPAEARRLIDAVNKAADEPDGRPVPWVPIQTDTWISAHMGSSPYPFTGYDYYYRVKHGLDAQQRKEVALAIWMDLAQRFEKNQGDFLHVHIAQTNSSFSQEDLPSDVIGFYMAINGWKDRDAVKDENGLGKSMGVFLLPEDGAKFLQHMGDLGDDKNKNKTFTPCDHNMEIADYLNDPQFKTPLKYPEKLKTIKPAPRGDLWDYDPR